jgi:hypothetical protein
MPEGARTFVVHAHGTAGPEPLRITKISAACSPIIPTTTHYRLKLYAEVPGTFKSSRSQVSRGQALGSKLLGRGARTGTIT